MNVAGVCVHSLLYALLNAWHKVHLYVCVCVTCNIAAFVSLHGSASPTGNAGNVTKVHSFLGVQVS